MTWCVKVAMDLFVFCLMVDVALNRRDQKNAKKDS